MQLSVREAATVLGRSPRTVRAQLQRGDLPGTKRDGRWRIPKEALPLTEPQRRALAAKAESLREALEQALPSRAAATTRSRAPCIDDSEAFRLGCRILGEVPAGCRDDEHLRRTVARLVERALIEIAVAVHQYDPELKLGALNHARRLLAAAAARLAIAPPSDPDPRPRDHLPGSLQLMLETELLPAVARAARRADRLLEHRSTDARRRE